MPTGEVNFQFIFKAYDRNGKMVRCAGYKKLAKYYVIMRYEDGSTKRVVAVVAPMCDPMECVLNSVWHDKPERQKGIPRGYDDVIAMLDYQAPITEYRPSRPKRWTVPKREK